MILERTITKHRSDQEKERDETWKRGRVTKHSTWTVRV